MKKKEILLFKLKRLEDERNRYKYLINVNQTMNTTLLEDLMKCEREIKIIKEAINKIKE